MQVKQDALRSDLDIDIYFDSLQIGSSDHLEAWDSEPQDDSENINFKSLDLVDIEISLLKAEPSTGFCLPTLPDWNRQGDWGKRALSQAALERLTHEVKVLSQQIKNTPQRITHRSKQWRSPSTGMTQSLKGRWVPTGLLSVLLGIACFYGYSEGFSPNSLGSEITALQAEGRPKTLQIRTASPFVQSSTLSAVASETFRTAVNHAMSAAELTQTAKTAEEWSVVANHWLTAIQLMHSMPSSHSKHDVAAQKVEEYARNLVYAQSNMTMTAPQQQEGSRQDSDKHDLDINSAIFRKPN